MARKVDMVPIVCAFCDRTKLIYPCRAGRGQHFCSPRCAYDAQRDISLADRFWRYVERGEGCWLWTAGKDGDGSGVVTIWWSGRKMQEKAHRVAWIVHHGAIPPGLCLLHDCDNPPCVRP